MSVELSNVEIARKYGFNKQTNTKLIGSEALLNDLRLGRRVEVHVVNGVIRRRILNDSDLSAFYIGDTTIDADGNVTTPDDGVSGSYVEFSHQHHITAA